MPFAPDLMQKSVNCSSSVLVKSFSGLMHFTMPLFFITSLNTENSESFTMSVISVNSNLNLRSDLSVPYLSMHSLYVTKLRKTSQGQSENALAACLLLNPRLLNRWLGLGNTGQNQRPLKFACI